MKKNQIYEELIEELDKKHKENEGESPEEFLKLENCYAKKLEKSVGWIEPETDVYVIKDGNVCIEKMRWTVNVGNESHIDCDKQEFAEILSLVAQVNERLKRVEKKLEE